MDHPHSNGLRNGVASEISWNEEEAREIVARHCQMPGATLPVLHALQKRFGYVDRTAIPVIAEALNLSQAEIHGVVSFYHDFRTAPSGRHVLKLCRAEACQAMGGLSLIAHIERRLGAKLGSTTPDGRITLEPTYCFGNCACAPAAMLDGALLGRLNASRIDAVLDGLDRVS
jgi:formate dehydrogenase subunit gamma